MFDVGPRTREARDEGSRANGKQHLALAGDNAALRDVPEERERV